MLITLLGRLVQFALMFASVKIMTHLLTPEEMGKVALITTATALFALFLINPAGTFINRRLHAWIDQGSFRRLFHLFAIYLLIVSLFTAVALCVAAWNGMDLVGTSPLFLVGLVCGSLLFSTIVQTLVPALNMVQRPRSFVLLTLGTLITSLGASILLNHGVQPTAERWLAGTLAGQALFALISYCVFFRGDVGPFRPQRPSGQQLRRAASFCWPIAVAVLLQWLHMQGYRFLLAERFGLAELGLYAAGYGVAASLMTAFDTLLTTWYQPLFYRMVNSTDATQRDAAWSTYAGVVVPASILGLTALIAASPSLPKVLLGQAFHDAGRYVLFGALAEWARTMVNLVSLNSHRHMSTSQLIVPNLIGTIATYVVLLATISALGLLAAPIAVFVGSFAVIGCLWFFTYRDDPHVHLPWRALLSWSVATALIAAATASLQVSFPEFERPVTALAMCLLIGVAWSGLAVLAMRQGLLKRTA